jgi:hypothetical protein
MKVNSNFPLLIALAAILTGPAKAVELTGDSIVSRMEIDKLALILDNNSEGLVPVWATSPEGPWTPLLSPIVNLTKEKAAVIPGSDQQAEFFKLLPGTQFQDDFNDGDDQGWTKVTIDERAMDGLNISFPDGGYRIETGECSYCIDPTVYLVVGGIVHSDFILSVDIVNFGENYLFGLGARGHLDAGVTLGIVNRRDDHPEKCNLYFYSGNEQEGVDGIGMIEIPGLNSAKDYRLVFQGSGRELRLQLYQLTDAGPGGPILIGETTGQEPETPRVGSMVGLWNWADNRDTTYDNFFVSALQPQ